jgi:hypothetical protein
MCVSGNVTNQLRGRWFVDEGISSRVGDAMSQCRARPSLTGHLAGGNQLHHIGGRFIKLKQKLLRFKAEVISAMHFGTTKTV